MSSIRIFVCFVLIMPRVKGMKNVYCFSAQTTLMEQCIIVSNSRKSPMSMSRKTNDSIITTWQIILITYSSSCRIVFQAHGVLKAMKQRCNYYYFRQLSELSIFDTTQDLLLFFLIIISVFSSFRFMLLVLLHSLGSEAK